MNDLKAPFLKTEVMPDVQSTRDERALPIEQVGIRGLRHPLTVRTKGGDFPAVGNFEMDVAADVTALKADAVKDITADAAKAVDVIK